MNWYFEKIEQFSSTPLVRNFFIAAEIELKFFKIKGGGREKEGGKGNI